MFFTVGCCGFNCACVLPESAVATARIPASRVLVMFFIVFSFSGMLRNMLPSGAEPKPSGPLISLSLMLMISPRVRSRGLSQRSSLPHLCQAFRLDTIFDRRPVVPGQTPGLQQVETFDA